MRVQDIGVFLTIKYLTYARGTTRVPKEHLFKEILFGTFCANFVIILFPLLQNMIT